MHRTRTPLTVWFAAAWHMTSSKRGVSVLGLQRALEIGSYQRLGRCCIATAVRWSVPDETGRRARWKPTKPSSEDQSPVFLAVARSERSWWRSPRAARPGLWTLRYAGHWRRERCDPADVPVRTRRAGFGGAQRWLPKRPVSLWAGLPTPSDFDLGFRPPGSRAAPRRPSRRLPRRALDRGHPPRSREACLGPVLSRRVLLPFQPQALASPRHALLPPARTGRPGCSPDVPLSRRRTRQHPPDDAGSADRQARALRQPGEASHRSPLARSPRAGPTSRDSSAPTALRWREFPTNIG